MLNKAIKIASLCSNKKFSLCAIITDKKGNILSIGQNYFNKSHPTQAYYAEKTGNRNRIFIHAEIDALIRLPYGVEPNTIYIARTNKKGNQTLLAQPCPICQMAIKESGIKNIIYTKGKN